MSDTIGPAPEEEPTDNEELVIGIALNVMAGKGWIYDETVDEELIETLRRLYRENPLCQVKVQFTGELMHDLMAARPGEYLASAYEVECQERWERGLPVWACDCGAEYKITPDPWGAAKRNDCFYRIASDGTLDKLVGSTRGRGVSVEARNTACPDCGREFVRTLARQADPQLSLEI
jgi:hypothetical protein